VNRAFQFFQLPTEIRIMIYEQMFRHPGVIGYVTPSEPGDFPFKDNGPAVNRYKLGKEESLSGQFLRTCKTAHNEGIPVLYGDNTFNICFAYCHPQEGPRFYAAAALEGLLSPYHRNVSRDGVACLRKFCLQFFTDLIHNPCEDRFRQVRHCLRRVAAKLEAPMQTITSLRIQYHPMCVFSRFLNGSWNIHDPDPDIPCEHLVVLWPQSEAFFAMISAWLGQLRVTTNDVTIVGIPPDTTKVLMQRLKSRSLPAVSLMTKFRHLEKHVLGRRGQPMPVDLEHALFAAEIDDQDRFDYHKAMIFRKLQASVQGLAGEKILWSPDVETEMKRFKRED